MDGYGYVLMKLTEEKEWPPKYVHPKCSEEAKKLVRDYLESHGGWTRGFMGEHYDWLVEFAEWLLCEERRFRGKELGLELDLPPLPKGFVEWARRRGFAEPIARGEKDLVEALKEWKKEGRPSYSRAQG